MTQTPVENFVRLRKERGYRSAQSLADAAGLTRNMIANFETGRKPELSIAELSAICRVLRVPPNEIFPELGDYAQGKPDEWYVERAKLELMKDFQEFMLTRVGS